MCYMKDIFPLQNKKYKRQLRLFLTIQIFFQNYKFIHQNDKLQTILTFWLHRIESLSWIYILK